MHVDIQCPHCSQAMRIADPQADNGKPARCPGCNQVFTLELSGVPGVSGKMAPGAAPSAAVPGVIFRGVVERLRLAANADQLRAIGRWMAMVGTYGMIGGIVLAPLYLLVMGFKADPVDGKLIILGLVAGIILTAIQFINQRLLSAIEGQVDAAPTRVSTTAVLDGMGMVFLLLAVAAPCWYFYYGLETKLYYLVFVGMAGSVVFGYLTLISTSPEFLHIEEDPKATPADDAMSLYAYLVKAYVAALPILYGIFVVFGCVGLFFGLLQVAMEAQADWVTAVHRGGVEMFVRALVLPVIGYVVGVLGLLSVFLLQAVLVIPEKLNQLIANPGANEPPATAGAGALPDKPVDEPDMSELEEATELAGEDLGVVNLEAVAQFPGPAAIEEDDQLTEFGDLAPEELSDDSTGKPAGDE